MIDCRTIVWTKEIICLRQIASGTQSCQAPQRVRGWGVEVGLLLFSYAQRVQKKLAGVFRDRGAKKDDHLYFLNGTKPPAILVESFFCDNKGDCELGNDMKKLGKLIADGIAGKTELRQKGPSAPMHKDVEKNFQMVPGL